MPHFRPSPLEVRELVRDTLAGAGLTEVVTTALVSPATSRRSCSAARSRPSATSPQPGGDPIGVGNPLSRDHSVLRRNLLGSLLDVVGGNLRHGTADVAVFEIGKGYARTGDEPREWWRLGVRARRRGRAARLEPRRPPVRPRRREGPARAARRPARPRRRGLRAGAPTSRCSTPAARRARASPDRLEAIVGELHPDDRRRLGAAHDRPGHRRRGRARGARRRPAGARSGRLRSAASPRSTATSRSSSPRRRPRPRSRPSIRAHAGELLRDVALFDIYRGVPARARARRASPPAPARRAGPDAHRARGRGGGRRRRGGAARRRGPHPDLTPAGDRTIARGGRAPEPRAGLPESIAGPVRPLLPFAGVTGRAGHAAAVTRGIVVGHRRNAAVDQRRRHSGRPVPVRDVRPGLHPGHHPPADRHRCRSRSRSSSRCQLNAFWLGEFLSHELDAVPARVLGDDRVPRDLRRRRSSRSSSSSRARTRKAEMFAKYPVVDEVLGGILGVVQGALFLLFVTIILDQYFLHTGIPKDDDELAFLRDFWNAINGSETGRILHENVDPGLPGHLLVPRPADVLELYGVVTVRREPRPPPGARHPARHRPFPRACSRGDTLDGGPGAPGRAARPRPGAGGRRPPALAVVSGGSSRSRRTSARTTAPRTPGSGPTDRNRVMYGPAGHRLRVPCLRDAPLPQRRDRARRPARRAARPRRRAARGHRRDARRPRGARDRPRNAPGRPRTPAAPRRRCPPRRRPGPRGGGVRRSTAA